MKRHIIHTFLAGATLLASHAQSGLSSATQPNQPLPALEAVGQSPADPGVYRGNTRFDGSTNFAAADASVFSGRAGIGGGMGVATSSGSRYSSRLAGMTARGGAAASGGRAAIYLEERPQKEMDEMAEDLNVLSLLVQRAIHLSIGDNATDYRLGVPMLLRGENRVVDASYLEGFGALVKVNLPFPVAGATQPIEKKPDAGGKATEWEKARRAIRSGNPADPTAGEDGIPSGGPSYDDKLVNSLRGQMIDVLRNASNLRHLKPDEAVAIAIMGGINPDSNRGTVMTMRIKKSDADELAKGAGKSDDLFAKTQTHSYFDNVAAPQTGGFGAVDFRGQGIIVPGGSSQTPSPAASATR